MITTNLIHAQSEEGKDVVTRNRYLSWAGLDSLKLAKRFISEKENREAAKYLLSAAYSYHEFGALYQSRMCFKMILDLGVDEFTDNAKEGLEKVNKLFNNLSISEQKEANITLLDYLVWEHRALNTLNAEEYFKEYGVDITTSTVRNYARELEKRNKVVIWGGPQGRVYKIYPNISELTSKIDYYGYETMIPGAIQERITDKFCIKFENWRNNQELFILNGSNKPKIIMAIDMDAFTEHIKVFSKPGFSVKALGTLENFDQFIEKGYAQNFNEKLDILDSKIIIDAKTNEAIYNRNSGADSLRYEFDFGNGLPMFLLHKLANDFPTIFCMATQDSIQFIGARNQLSIVYELNTGFSTLDSERQLSDDSNHKYLYAFSAEDIKTQIRWFYTKTNSIRPFHLKIKTDEGSIYIKNEKVSGQLDTIISTPPVPRIPIMHGGNYFRIDNLKDMIKQISSIREEIIRIKLDASKEILLMSGKENPNPVYSVKVLKPHEQNEKSSTLCYKYFFLLSSQIAREIPKSCEIRFYNNGATQLFVNDKSISIRSLLVTA